MSEYARYPIHGREYKIIKAFKEDIYSPGSVWLVSFIATLNSSISLLYFDNANKTLSYLFSKELLLKLYNILYNKDIIASDTMVSNIKFRDF